MHAGNINMAFYSIYTMPGWTGGAYGTPKDAGSVSCVNILHAMVALLHIGKNGYRQMAEGIHATTQEMAAIMDKYPPLEVLRPVYVNLVSCRISKDSEWGPTAIYAFAHEMDTRGFVFSGVKGNILHFCVTARLSNNKHQMAKFNSAVKDAMGVVAGYVLYCLVPLGWSVLSIECVVYVLTMERM